MEQVVMEQPVIEQKEEEVFDLRSISKELEALPSFANAYVDNSATKFQIVVRGDVAKPLSLVKSFKWLSGEAEYQTAIDFVNSIPEPFLQTGISPLFDLKLTSIFVTSTSAPE